jgi:hypothetical protein
VGDTVKKVRIRFERIAYIREPAGSSRRSCRSETALFEVEVSEPKESAEWFSMGRQAEVVNRRV